MNATSVCPRCGKELTGDAPQGMCPECLLKAAIPSEAETSPPRDPRATVTPAEANGPGAGARLKYFGDYELLDEIARGGMGVVWKARQTSLNREVAVKMIRDSALAGSKEVERFLREAEAAANLQHPNIVAIHEVGEHDGQHYFSMDYVDGRDLAAIVKEGPLEPWVAARYVKTIAEAIHYAHQRGTLHRDLKPQNVLIDADDQPRITDFGLAKIMKEDSGLTHTGVVMGSPSYMSPEQAAGRNDEIGPASDVYSLGAMLYELLTGRPPFRGSTAAATMREVMEAEPVPPRRIKSDVPPDLETICLKCLEKSPPARYPTARSLAEDLGRHLSGEPIQARPVGIVRKATNWARRNPSTLAGLAALVIVALAFGVFYLFEENAFLRAQQTNPELTRVAGWRHELVKVCNAFNMYVFLGAMYTYLAVIAKAKRLPFTAMWKANQQFRPMQPIGKWMRTLALCVGVASAGIGVAYLILLIQAHVWEGESILTNLFPTYASIGFGLILIALAIRDYRLTHYGMPTRNLTADQLVPIRTALENGDLNEAIQLYRQEVPSAGLGEAREYAMRLAEPILAENPEKFTPQPLSFSNLNWGKMAIVAGIEAVVVAVMMALLGPTQPFAFAVQFGGAFIIGIWVMASSRIRTLWKRFLMVLAAMFLFLTGILFFSLLEGMPRNSIAYLAGLLCGLFLLLAGFTPKRRRIRP